MDPVKDIDVVVVDEAPAADANLSDMEVLDQALEKIGDAPDADAAADADADPVDDTIEKESEKDEPVEDEAAKEVEEPAEEPKADDKADDESKNKKDAKETDEDDEFSPSLSVHALNTRITKTPELKSLLDKDPAFRKSLFYTARQADRAGKYDDLFQTPALAAEVSKAAEGFYEFKGLYESEDSTKFLQKLYFDSLEKDEKGNVKLDSLNRPVSNGSYTRHMDAYRDIWFKHVAASAEAYGEGVEIMEGTTREDVLEAIKILRAVTEGSADGTKPAAKDKALPKEVQDKLDELERMKAEKSANATQSLSEFKSSVESETKTAFETDVKNLLAKRLPKDAAIGDYFKDKIVSDTVNAIMGLADKNRAHQNLLSTAIKNASRDAEGRKKIVTFQQSFAKELYARELTKVLTQAGPGVVTAAAATASRIKEQQNRTEVRTNGGVASPSRPANPKVEAKAIDAALTKSKGRRPSDEEFFDAVVAGTQR